MEKLKATLEAFGIDADALTKIEAGELDPKEFAQSHLSEYENNIKTRISSELESRIRGEEIAKAYGSTESFFTKEFGIDIKEFDGVEGAKRKDAIVKKIKTIQAQQLEAIKNNDGTLVAQLTKQLEDSNAALDQTKAHYEGEINNIKTSYQQKEQMQVFDNVVNGLITNFENPRKDKKDMLAVFKMELQEKGYKPEFDSANGKIWLVKDGARIPNPNKQTQNLDINAFFEIVAAENNFKKESNAGAGDKTPLSFTNDKGDLKVHPNFIKAQLNK